jgi:HTH-type transcriptional regulator / antitoxin HigA
MQGKATNSIIRRYGLTMRNFRTLDEVTEQYFRDYPDEIDDFLTEIFEDYAQDSDTGVLLSLLRVIARVRGVSAIAEMTGMTRQDLQKALSEDGNPRLENVNSIMKAMGYSLMPQKLPQQQPTPH